MNNNENRHPIVNDLLKTLDTLKEQVQEQQDSLEWLLNYKTSIAVNTKDLLDFDIPFPIILNKINELLKVSEDLENLLNTYEFYCREDDDLLSYKDEWKNLIKDLLYEREKQKRT